MNGLEYLYHLLFVEVDKGLWGIIGFGIVIAIASLWYDKYNETDVEIPPNKDWF